MNTSENTIKIWRFEDAPIKYQQLSTNGGDEDWVVEIPTGIPYPDDFYWLSCIDTCGIPQKYFTEDKLYIIYIGSHA